MLGRLRCRLLRDQAVEFVRAALLDRFKEQVGLAAELGVYRPGCEPGAARYLLYARAVIAFLSENRRCGVYETTARDGRIVLTSCGFSLIGVDTDSRAHTGIIMVAVRGFSGMLTAANRRPFAFVASSYGARRSAVGLLAPRNMAYSLAMGYKDLMNQFAQTRFGAAVGRTFAARVDPWLYKVSGGKFTSVGPQLVPQMIMTTIGRKSGQERTVQVAYTIIDGDIYIVGSNFGQEHHPAWSANLIANPDAEIRIGRHTQTVTAESLSDDDKTAVWNKLVANVPNYGTYVTRTNRNIRVFRLHTN